MWYELICLGPEANDNSHVPEGEPWVLLLRVEGAAERGRGGVGVCPWVRARGCVCPWLRARGCALVNS